MFYYVELERIRWVNRNSRKSLQQTPLNINGQFIQFPWSWLDRTHLKLNLKKVKVHLESDGLSEPLTLFYRKWKVEGSWIERKGNCEIMYCLEYGMVEKVI